VLPPTAPVTPVWPKRTLALAAILLAAFVVGAGVSYALTLFKPIVSSVRSVNELTSFPVLGVVGVAFPSQQRREFRSNIWRFSAATACLLGAFSVALILNWSGARLTIQAIRALVKT
jgi:cytochrome bd-type quinol oxidase subunit 2